MNNAMINIMKPMPVIEDKTAFRAEQEEAVIQVMNKSSVSMSSRDILNDFNYDPFPGINAALYSEHWDPDKALRDAKRRAISATLKRLEGKGIVVSTIFHGSRYYSIPVVS